MKMRLFKILTISSGLMTLASPSYAFKGSISYSADEMRRHENGLPVIMDTAAKCLQQDLNKHAQFMRTYGVSAFYGENASFAKAEEKDANGQPILDARGKPVKRATSSEEKREILREYGLDENLVEQLVPTRSCNSPKDCPLRMEPSSCVGLALKCLQRGFAAAGQTDLWARLRKFTRDNDVTGNSLQFGLRKLGWRTVYWTPDESRAAHWDADERKIYPKNPLGIWGRHVESLHNVLNRHMYSDVPVDDDTSAVNFGNGSPEIFKRVPFFVGIAHLGYHVFPGSFGRIVEAHSTREINDPEEVQASIFSPLSPGGGPQGGPRVSPGDPGNGNYKSGLIAIPPGY